MSPKKRADLDALVAEATVDCYNDSECVTGFYTMDRGLPALAETVNDEDRDSRDRCP
jgi:hypothetical protein